MFPARPLLPYGAVPAGSGERWPGRAVPPVSSLGCTYIQMDAPQYPLLIDPGWRAFYEERGLAAAALAGVRDRT